MRAGRLRHVGVLQSPSGTQNAVGQRVTLWADEATVRVGIEPLKAAEVIAAAQTHMVVTHRIVLRHDSSYSDMTHGWRIVYDQRTFDIQGIRNINELNRSYELLCNEGLLYTGTGAAAPEAGVFSTDFSADFA